MRVTNFVRVLAVLVAASLAGCISSTTLIKLKADGSGTIEQTTLMSAQAAAQMGGLTAMLASGKNGQSGSPEMFSEARMREAAGELGEGVTFVSFDKLKTADAEGARAVYAFTDITKIRVDQKPGGSNNMAEMPGMMMGGTKKETMTFGFTAQPGGNSLVTVRFPEADLNASKSTAAAMPAPEQLQIVQMIKPFLKGLKIAVDLEVTGRIVKTNSQYASGNRVTLLEMDFEQLLGNDAVMAELQQAKSVEDAKRLLKDVKGVKVNPDREVTVEFGR